MKLRNIVIGLALFGTTAAAFSLSMSVSAPNQPSTRVDRRSFVGSAAAIGAAAATGGLSAKPALADDDFSDFETTESGMKYKITKEGDGALPLAGQTVKTQYTGWLDGFDSIRKFDSSRDRGRPFSFKVGAGQVIRGWDEAFLSMKVGERRQIILPSRLAYGERGAGGIIPGGAILYFVSF
jgi:FKBP-type peptidyl-prolyl cis-trans isomerase